MNQRSEMQKEMAYVLGHAVMEMQEKHRHLNIDVVIPEIIATLLSLANNIARKNAGLTDLDFIQACITAAREKA